MQEEQPLYETLLSRLPPDIRNYAKWYGLLRRYPMYFHHMIRRLLDRDLENAMKSYRYISQSGHALLIALFWLFTINQKLYRMKPRFVGSEKAKMTPVLSSQF